MINLNTIFRYYAINEVTDPHPRSLNPLEDGYGKKPTIECANEYKCLKTLYVQCNIRRIDLQAKWYSNKSVKAKLHEKLIGNY